MKRKLIKIINEIIFHFLFWSVILAQSGTISVIITGLIRCLLYSFLSSSSLPPFPFSFLLFLIISLNGFIKCLGPNSGTLQSWLENRHILMLQKLLYYEPMSWPVQTLHISYPSSTASLPEGVIHSRSRSQRMGWGSSSNACMAYKVWWSHLLIFWAHPFYPHHHCMEVLHCSGMHLSGPTAATWDTALGLSWLCPLCLRSRMAKVDKYLRPDHCHLQGSSKKALNFRGCSQKLLFQVK